MTTRTSSGVAARCAAPLSIGFLVATFVLSSAAGVSAYAQQSSGQPGQPGPEQPVQPELVAARGPDGQVYVYVTADLALTDRVNLYRVDANGEHLLTTTPLSLTTDPARFVSDLGSRYEQLAADLQTETAMETLLRLAGDRSLSVVVSVTDSVAGRLLGRLLIDRSAPGDDVSYRAAVLARGGSAEGRSFSSGVVTTGPRPPENVSVQAEATSVAVKWTYDQNSQLTDLVTQFHVYATDARDGAVRQLTETGLLRLSSQEQYTYRFEAEIGNTYKIVVAAVTAGYQVVQAEPVTIEILDNVPPSKITAVAARTLADSVVVLSWAPPDSDPTGASYIVRRATSLEGPFVEIGRLNRSGVDVFTDRNLRARITYHYSVTAIDSLGNVGVPGDVANAYVPDLTPPEDPSGLAATASGKQVRLTWSGTMPPDFNTFVVSRRRLDHRGPIEPFSQANESEVRATNLVDDGPGSIGFVEGAYYEYVVVAADSAANFSDSARVVIQVPDDTPPRAPTSVRVRREARGIAVTWAASTSRDVSGYGVYRTEGEGGSETMVSEIGPDQRDVRDATAPKDIRIRYRIEARDSSDNIASAQSDWLLVGDAEPPAPPRNLQAVSGTQSASLMWIGSGSAGTTGYRIERAAFAGAAFESIGETDATNFADPAGRPGHVYRVLALDESGNSSFPSATAILR